MELFNAIYGRRSIRSFTSEPVSESDIEAMLRAAMAAPSAGNEQPWHFVTIDDRKTLDAIPMFHPYATALNSAALAIVVCGDLSLERYKGFWVQDCSAAIQNLLLAIHGLGLGAVWLAGYPVEDRVDNLQKLLNIPKGVIPLAIIAVGHPAEKKSRTDRFNPDRIHRNVW